jgi:cytochrome c peroxidase
MAWGYLFRRLGTAVALFAVTSCASEGDSGGAGTESVGEVSQALSTHETACNGDPRVWEGLVTFDECVGARLFFDEKFNGNGRTCGSCHPASNNFTIDRTFMQSLPATDPLFIADSPSFPLASLEVPELHTFGLIRENLDGFGDLDHKFVLRSVPHLFSMSTTLARDTTDGTSAAFAERAGWSGDGVTGGTLRDFTNGAIEQHFPKDLSRTPGTSFRVATASELDRIRAFQLALGRKNELNLNNVHLTDSFAEQGRLDFLDPQIGRCNECHGNAGANALATGKNANFFGNFEQFAADHASLPVLNGVTIRDGGFGGQGLASPNVKVRVNTAVPDGFGDGSFNTAPLIEAADTGPFFHHNNSGSEGPVIGLVAAITFYASSNFNESPAGQKLIQQFGTPITLPGSSNVEIAAFLRVLNTFFNLDLATQRLNASKRLNSAYWDYRKDVQQGLLKLGREEVADALKVLASSDGPPLHVAQQATISSILTKVDAALATTDPATRLARTNEALALIAGVRPTFGTGVTFTLGAGTLMF